MNRARAAFERRQREEREEAAILRVVEEFPQASVVRLAELLRQREGIAMPEATLFRRLGYLGFRKTWVQCSRAHRSED